MQDGKHRDTITRLETTKLEKGDRGETKLEMRTKPGAELLKSATETRE
jgi:hypothetical protein